MYTYIIHTYIYTHRDCTSCDQATEYIDSVDPTTMERFPHSTNDCLSTHRDSETVPVLGVEGDEDTESVSRTLCKTCYSRYGRVG